MFYGCTYALIAEAYAEMNSNTPQGVLNINQMDFYSVDNELALNK